MKDCARLDILEKQRQKAKIHEYGENYSLGATMKRELDGAKKNNIYAVGNRDK